MCVYVCVLMFVCVLVYLCICTYITHHTRKYFHFIRALNNSNFMVINLHQVGGYQVN